MNLSVKDHLNILLIKAGIRTKKKLAEIMKTSPQHISFVLTAKPIKRVRHHIFEVLRNRLPEEIREYSDVWIDEDVKDM